MRVLCIHTPWLHVESNDRLRGRLGLAFLLLSVLRQSLLADLGRLSILFLIVRAEEVDLVVILLLLLRGLGRVHWKLGRLWTVGSVGLAWVSGQLRELWLEGGDVSIPAKRVRVLLDLGCLLELLEALNVGLGWSITVRMSARGLKFRTVYESGKARCSKLRGAQKRVGSTHLQGLKLLINTDQIVLIM